VANQRKNCYRHKNDRAAVRFSDGQRIRLCIPCIRELRQRARQDQEEGERELTASGMRTPYRVYVLPRGKSASIVKSSTTMEQALHVLGSVAKSHPLSFIHHSGRTVVYARHGVIRWPVEA